MKICNYQYMVKILKSMDDKQLLELFHDIDSEDQVENIINSGQYYLDSKYMDKEPVTKDYQEVDDIRRYKESKL